MLSSLGAWVRDGDGDERRGGAGGVGTSALCARCFSARPQPDQMEAVKGEGPGTAIPAESSSRLELLLPATFCPNI